MAAIVSDPSLNGGRNSPPIQAIHETEIAINPVTTTSTAVLYRNVNRNRCVSAHFSQRSSSGSFFRMRKLAPGSR